MNPLEFLKNQLNVNISENEIYAIDTNTHSVRKIGCESVTWLEVKNIIQFINDNKKCVSEDVRYKLHWIMNRIRDNYAPYGQYTKPLPFEITTSTLFYSRDLILTEKDRHYEIIDFDVWLPTKGRNLQRPLEWNLSKKVDFIISILKGCAIWNISVVFIWLPDRKSKKEIIDGKQRLHTLKEFLQNEFPIDGEIYFKDLDCATRSHLMGISIVGNVTYDDLTDDDKIAWFKRINFGGQAVSQAHLDTLE